MVIQAILTDSCNREKKIHIFSEPESPRSVVFRYSQPQPSEEPKKKSPKKSKKQKELDQKFEFFENFKQPKLYPDQAPVLERIKNKILDRMHKSTDKSMENSKQHINVEIRVCNNHNITLEESQEESPVTGHKDEMSAITDREILPQIAKKCKSRNLITNQKESSRKYRSKFSLPRYPSMPGCGSILFKDYTKKNVKNKDIEKIGKFKEKVIQISTKQKEATEALNRSIDHESNEVDKMIQKMNKYIRNR
ncbi:unnamed protein product [Moneuplotes crassus]|uniref:Uncharacterized protein n=1 Tax=Euplotes crassus TaxID=5936 RepID=A0AAD1UB77_EUPCR|nr:unnamed protein product [Moneuplotes crassus]